MEGGYPLLGDILPFDVYVGIALLGVIFHRVVRTQSQGRITPNLRPVGHVSVPCIKLSVIREDNSMHGSYPPLVSCLLNVRGVETMMYSRGDLDS